MKCPVCKTPDLQPHRVGDVDVDHCPTCRGWWLDSLELERITALNPREIRRADSTAAVSQREAPSPLACPRCGGGQLIRLNSLDRPGTVLDSCTLCYGVWADAGELTRVTRADTLSAILRSFFVRDEGKKKGPLPPT